MITSQRKNGSWVDRRYDARGNRVDDQYGSAYATEIETLRRRQAWASRTDDLPEGGSALPAAGVDSVR